ncbi:4-hydroxy-tetrahydrodipicolinate reductase [Bacillus marinisedimentorum]|uniref:4-hydroxy-tetrahydrodipicolinate reductase n=1 Tax=Bacillus marinisedimentorum TaxID=1821260 RepID=UPI0008723447|nr:4-hydroxy-tetrahydrodipicolinate reductase [Bacillus marinisedimentorum]
METIRIILAGPRGRMGRAAVGLIENTSHFELAAAIDRKNDGKMLGDLEDMPALNARVYEDIEQCLSETDADVLIDLTTPEVGKLHTEAALRHGVCPVVGTTGFSSSDIAELTALAEERETGAIIAPNFAVGAVLMMKFARMAARYFPDVEIIEKHHDRKLDAPSGTAVKTAELIAEIRESKKQGHPDEQETMEGARGASYDGIPIHSIRLPGLLAHQEVIFGSAGQTLTIKHDSFDRGSFMSGVKVAVETVKQLDTLVYGLENILE